MNGLVIKPKKDSSSSIAYLRKKKVLKSEPPKFVEEETKAEDGYDGYYDDVVPADTGKPREGIDWILMKKIGLAGVAVVVTICLCVTVMYLL